MLADSQTWVRFPAPQNNPPNQMIPLKLKHFMCLPTTQLILLANSDTVNSSEGLNYTIRQESKIKMIWLGKKE
jgi:hypothetical protein